MENVEEISAFQFKLHFSPKIALIVLDHFRNHTKLHRTCLPRLATTFNTTSIFVFFRRITFFCFDCYQERSQRKEKYPQQNLKNSTNVSFYWQTEKKTPKNFLPFEIIVHCGVLLQVQFSDSTYCCFFRVFLHNLSFHVDWPNNEIMM